jgi:hypothetical protein
MAALPKYSHVNKETPAWASALEQFLPTPDLQVSTLTVNMDGTVNLQSDNSLYGAAIQFVDESDEPIYMRNVVIPDVESAPLKGVGLTFSDNSETDPTYAPIGVASLTIMGDNEYNLGATAVLEPFNGNAKALSITSRYTFTSNLWVSTINGKPPGVAVLPSDPIFSTVTVAKSTITDSLIANAAYISSAFISTMQVREISSVNINTQNINTSSINGGNIFFSTTSGGSALFSSLITNSVSSVFGDITFQLVSTLQFNPSLGGVSLGGVDLGMGGFLGGLVGGVGSGIFNTILGGAALTTGIIALTNSRGTNQINESNYEMVNTTTQLQVSTLGQSTISYLRLVSSIAPNRVPGFEYIVSSIVQAGTTCIRSLSDPVNLANPSTATSTIQSFGSWVPLPSNAPPAPETISTVSFASISSLTVSSINGQTYLPINASFSNITVSSINGQPYTPGGGGGGGSFDFNQAMNQLSTPIKWATDVNAPFNQIIEATTNDLSNISTGFLRVITGNNSGGYGNSNMNGLLNWRLVPSAFAGAYLQTGETTIIPSYYSLASTIALSTMVTLRNNTPAQPNTPAYLEMVQAGGNGDLDNPGLTVPTEYAGLVIQDLYLSTITGQPTTINAGANINVNCDTFVINSNGNDGVILAEQAAPSITCNINYHNIGGCFLGYYGVGSALLPNGFQTGITANVFNGGIQMSNGWLQAVSFGGTPNSRVNACTFDIQAGLGGLQQYSNLAPGSNIVNFNILKPGVYQLMAGVTSGASAFGYSVRTLLAVRTGANQLSYQFTNVVESSCFWSLASFPNSTPGNPLILNNGLPGASQPFCWSILTTNYLEGQNV